LDAFRLEMALVSPARFGACDRGATAVEFALIAPLFVLLLSGAIYAGVLIFSAMGLQTAVEKAARCYSVSAAACNTVSAAQTYAQSSYYGAGSPAFVASTPSCGHQVNATLTFEVGWTQTLAATSCFP
jgi:Flp pilus assembly protein TadG